MENVIRSKTICALATPQGYSGISVIRVSGAETLKIVRKLAPFLPIKVETHKIYFGRIIDINKNVVDECILSYFSYGKSYTGEETIEINCHGNPLISKKILNELITLGCSIAQPGEFTLRAFLNGKIDLIQAEGVLSTINSNNQKSLKVAIDQLGGKLSKQIEEIENKLINVLAYLEASIDFSHEGIEILSDKEFSTQINYILNEINQLTISFRKGKILKDGFQIVFFGRPNVGKSSLLNLMSEQEKAIVTEIPGTTRDLISSEILIDGIKTVLTDTAGVHNTFDKIEKIGVSKTFEKIKEADLIIFITDLSLDSINNKIQIHFSLEERDFIVEREKDKKPYFVFINKSDLLNGNYNEEKAISAFEEIFEMETKRNNISIQNKPEHIIVGSAFLENTRKEIENKLSDYFSYSYEFLRNENSVIMQARHYEELLKVQSFLLASLDLLNGKGGYEFLVEEMMGGLFCIQRILGKKYDDQILDKIFKEFCIGK